MPKSQQDPPTVYGIEPSYLKIAGLKVLQGRFFSEDEETRGSAVCVLGAAAKSSLESMKAAWGDATNAATSGDYSTAMSKAQAVKDQATQVMQSLGMSSG